MIVRIVWSHVQLASTPAFLSKWKNAFSPSSTVGNPLCGMTGSSGRLGLAGRDVIGSDPGATKAEGVKSVGVDCEGVVIVRAF